MLDFIVTVPSNMAVVRSGWIVRILEDFPRLTTCYVKGKVGSVRLWNTWSAVKKKRFLWSSLTISGGPTRRSI